MCKTIKNYKLSNYLLILLGFILIGVAAYWRVIFSFFISDDFILLYSVITSGPFGAHTGKGSLFFRPLTSLAMFINYKIWGLNPVGYHLANVVFHSLNAFLLSYVSFLFLEQINPGWRLIKLASLFSGLLFLLLSCHSEPVAWISSIGDILATSLFLVTLIFYIQYVIKRKWFYLIISLVCSGCAYLFKESVAILPLVIFVYNCFLYFLNRSVNITIKKIFIYPMFYVVVIIPVLIARYYSISKLIGGYSDLAYFRINAHFLASNFYLYILRTFFFRYYFPLINIYFIVLIMVLIIMLIKVGVSSFRNIKFLLFLFIFFSATLLPVINYGVWDLDTQSERYVYLPSLFSSMMIIFSIGFIIRKRIIFSLLVILLLIFSSFKLDIANKNWALAGEISKGILSSFEKFSDDKKLLLLNLPDHIKGAYIFKNGIEESLKIFKRNHRYEVILVSLHNIKSKNDRVSVENNFSSYTLRLLNPDLYFLELNSAKRKDYLFLNVFPIKRLDSGSFQIGVVPESHELKILFYSEGKIHEL